MCVHTGERGCIRKPKHEQQRTEGEYGYGGYKDEPWSMQALEKRIYAVRDFYKNVLKGMEHENPGEAQSVCDALARCCGSLWATRPSTCRR